MINLLPELNKRKLKRTYLLRLLTVTLFAIASLAVVHSVLLVPSYVFLQAQVLNQEVEKEFTQKTLEASGSDEVEARLKALNGQIALLQTLPEESLFISAIEEVLEVSRTGIAITQISYAPKHPEVQITVRGIAVDRDALRVFAKTLEERDEIRGVDFPISNLSKEKDLPFNISITLES